MVTAISQVAVDGTSYHRPCFKCSHGGCMISPSNYVAHDHKLYCRHHHTQLFKQRGNFSHMEDHDKIKGVSENGKAMSPAWWKFSCSCDFAIRHREPAIWPESGAEVKHIYTRGLFTMPIYNIFIWESTEFHFIFLFLSWSVFYLINQMILPNVCTMWLFLWLSGNWSGFKFKKFKSWLICWLDPKCKTKWSIKFIIT